LITELAKRGYQATAMETSPEARRMMAALASSAQASVDVVDASAGSHNERFSLCLAFEVLEHIEDDDGALRQWASWLNADGHLLMSVPAHASLWNPGDEWAGHFRRYERPQLEAQLKDAGFELIRFESWGFPLANVMLPITSLVYRSRLRARGTTSKAAATAASGVERSLQVRLHWLLVNPLTALAYRVLFCLQALFAQTELGVGFLVLARKSKPPVQRPLGRGG
jgi:SAM-dependent methyltransferase